MVLGNRCGGQRGGKFADDDQFSQFREIRFKLSEHADKGQRGKYYIRSIEHRASDKAHFLSDNNSSDVDT